MTTSLARSPQHALLCWFLAVLPALPATGQLAITEVMSAPSPTAVQVDDFWELTNFGTNVIDLSEYWFRDEGGFDPSEKSLAAWWAATRLDPPLVEPYESVIWVRSRTDVITTPEDFIQWWGVNRLPAGLKIILYQGFGFSGAGNDAVQLFRVTQTQTNLVQRVELFDSLVGRSFTYHSETGLLDRFSVAGVDRAFVAASSDDVGSPGYTIGSVPLGVDQTPENSEVDGGAPATFSVKAHGLPVPQYQWRFNGVAIPGATAPTLIIPAATEAQAGQYSVEIRNGLEQILTSPATLTVNTSPLCAAIVRPVAEVEVCPGQTACFTVETRGYPLPNFQWRSNDVPIPGATSNTLTIANVNESQVGFYSVLVSNFLCTTSANTRLRLVPWPNLEVTEAMASPSLNTAAIDHNSWWELTNVGTNAVNLRGYRWDDNSLSLSNAVVVKEDVILLAGQSAIFVSSMTPTSFRRWWGEENLPEILPIISYSGNGISSMGDDIRVWNAAAREGDEPMLDYFALDTNSIPALGFSLEIEPGFPGSLGVPSVAGERGAFQAADSDDIGSPGWTSNEQRAAPRFLSISRDSSGVRLRWKTELGRTYTLEKTSNIGNPDWKPLMSQDADGPWLAMTNAPGNDGGRGFYRVLLQPLVP